MAKTKLPSGNPTMKDNYGYNMNRDRFVINHSPPNTKVNKDQCSLSLKKALNHYDDKQNQEEDWWGDE